MLCFYFFSNILSKELLVYDFLLFLPSMLILENDKIYLNQLLIPLWLSLKQGS